MIPRSAFLPTIAHTWFQIPKKIPFLPILGVTTYKCRSYSAEHDPELIYGAESSTISAKITGLRYPGISLRRGLLRIYHYSSALSKSQNSLGENGTRIGSFESVSVSMEMDKTIEKL